MNIHTDKAGYATGKHIKKSGFTVFDTITGNDMGQMDWEIPQYENDKCKITGGYWEWCIKDLEGNEIWRGWWNSNDEFDQTMKILSLT